MPVDCPKYEPLPGSKKCRHYVDEEPHLTGACAREDEFMCVVWLRKYPHSWEDPQGRMHPVDSDGVVYETKYPKL